MASWVTWYHVALTALGCAALAVLVACLVIAGTAGVVYCVALVLYCAAIASLGCVLVRFRREHAEFVVVPQV